MALHMGFFMLTVVTSAFVLLSDETSVNIYYFLIAVAGADFVSVIILAFICSQSALEAEVDIEI